MAISYVTTDLNVATVPFDWAARHMQLQMLRNIATSNWVFRKDALESRAGCIIASPSLPDGAATDQDYVHFWVRDGAVTIVEAVNNTLLGNAVLDDYVEFSRICQTAATKAGCPDRACFEINGDIRAFWTDQTDSRAHSIDALVDIFNHLGPRARETALVMLRADVDHVLDVYAEPTFNLWEETKGYSYFARSVQKRALRRVRIEAAKFGLSAEQVKRIAETLEALDEALAEHATSDGSRPYYKSILSPSNGDRGADLNVDVVMAAIYGAASCRDPLILSTAAKLREYFSALFPINGADRLLGLGPTLGRYPGDEYDGNGVQPNQGHPWPLTTCNFAELYYQVAGIVLAEGRNDLFGSAREFFEQIGIVTANDPNAVGKLVTAGDAMMSAVIYHSDSLELSEQIHRDTGYQVSVRSLTWSYAAFLHALKQRQRAVGIGFGQH